MLVGWRETIALPEFGLEKIYAKLDSGACLSALHAEKIELFQKLNCLDIECFSKFLIDEM